MAAAIIAAIQPGPHCPVFWPNSIQSRPKAYNKQLFKQIAEDVFGDVIF